MKPISTFNKQAETTNLKGVPFFPHCCPYTQQHIVLEEGAFRKNKKFITLSKNIENRVKTEQIQGVHNRANENVKEPGVENSFLEDKMSFLQQIRNYNPEIEKSPSAESKGLDSTMDMNSGYKSQENNLSSLLESLNNEMFSDLFVSSAVKGKIIMSASLGKISEVKSDMEVSCISQVKLITHHNIQDES